LRDFIALARSKSGALNYASAGTGNPNHLAAEMLNMLTGAKMQHVPYKGSGPAIADLVGGQVHLHFATPIAVSGLIQNGKLRALAVSGEARSAALPQIPTFAEAGLPGFDMRVVYGLVAPAATPRDIVGKVSGELARIVSSADYRARITAYGLDPVSAAPEAFAAIIQADLAKFAKIIKAADIRLEN
jgi:tripartite-type tricarboxylate transporter receptor subunit TctC